MVVLVGLTQIPIDTLGADVRHRETVGHPVVAHQRLDETHYRLVDDLAIPAAEVEVADIHFALLEGTRRHEVIEVGHVEQLPAVQHLRPAADLVRRDMKQFATVEANEADLEVVRLGFGEPARRPPGCQGTRQEQRTPRPVAILYPKAADRRHREVTRIMRPYLFIYALSPGVSYLPFLYWKG